MTLWDFVSILVTINNYFHDFATAVIIVGTYVMWLMLGYAAKSGDKDLPSTVAALYPRLLHVTGGTLMLLLMAGIVRSFTYKWFEWVEVLGMGQIVVLIFKHVFMFAIVGYGIYVWAGMHKKIKLIRGE